MRSLQLLWFRLPAASSTLSAFSVLGELPCLTDMWGNWRKGMNAEGRVWLLLSKHCGGLLSALLVMWDTKYPVPPALGPMFRGSLFVHPTPYYDAKLSKPTEVYKHLYKYHSVSLTHSSLPLFILPSLFILFLLSPIGTKLWGIRDLANHYCLIPMRELQQSRGIWSMIRQELFPKAFPCPGKLPSTWQVLPQLATGGSELSPLFCSDHSGVGSAWWLVQEYSFNKNAKLMTFLQMPLKCSQKLKKKN